MTPTKQEIVIRNITKDKQTDTNAQENKPLLQTVCKYAPICDNGNCEKCTHLLTMKIINLNTGEQVA